MDKMNRIAVRVANCTLEDVSTVRFNYLVESINEVSEEIDELIEDQRTRVKKTRKSVLESTQHLKVCVKILLDATDSMMLEHAMTSQNNFHNLWHHTWALYLCSTHYEFRSMQNEAKRLASKISRAKKRFTEAEHEYVVSLINNYCVVSDLVDEMGLNPITVGNVVKEFNRYLSWD